MKIRTEWLTFRVKPHEKEKVKEDAHKHEKNVGEYIRIKLGLQRKGKK